MASWTVPVCHCTSYMRIQDTLSCLDHSLFRKRTLIGQVWSSVRDVVSLVLRVGTLDPRSRWVPPLGPVGPPLAMGNSTKGNLYTYIHSILRSLWHFMNCYQMCSSLLSISPSLPTTHVYFASLLIVLLSVVCAFSSESSDENGGQIWTDIFDAFICGIQKYGCLKCIIISCILYYWILKEQYEQRERERKRQASIFFQCQKCKYFFYIPDLLACKWWAITYSFAVRMRARKCFGKCRIVARYMHMLAAWFSSTVYVATYKSPFCHKHREKKQLLGLLMQ